MKIENILSVGKGNGEMDFEIASTITELSLEQMNEFRAMLSVAIGTAEQMWRRQQNENFLTQVRSLVGIKEQQHEGS